LQSLATRECRDQERNAENEIFGGRILPLLSVYKSLNSELLRKIFFGNRDRANWAKRVRRLSEVKLLVVSLAFSRGHVVDDGVSPYMIHGILFFDLETWFADNDADFSFVVRTFGETWVREDIVTVGDDRCRPFRENNRMCGLVKFV
jgi:hypothetical protein